MIPTITMPRRLMAEWSKLLLAILGFGVLFGVGIYAGFAIPGRWDGAVVLKICRDGTPILRDREGEIWARRTGFVAYRVIDPEKICQP